MKGWMYILRCADNSYYVGSTSNLELRMVQHKEGSGSVYTGCRLPVELVYSEEFQTIEEAFKREKQVQGWSRRKREALMNGAFDDLVKFSASTKMRKESGGLAKRSPDFFSRENLISHGTATRWLSLSHFDCSPLRFERSITGHRVVEPVETCSHMLYHPVVEPPAPTVFVGAFPQRFPYLR